MYPPSLETAGTIEIRLSFTSVDEQTLGNFGKEASLSNWLCI